jgi:phage host-nuclease inhibitor protein Gam
MKRESTWLGLEPTVTDCETAELALREVAALRVNNAELKAAYEVRLAALNEEAKAATMTIVDGIEQPLSERAKELEQAVLDWADENRSTLCDGKSKTVELRGGTLSWRKKADAVTFLPDWDEKQAVAKLWKKGSLRPMLDAVLLKVLNLFGAVTIQLKIDRTAAKKAVQAGQLKKNRLRSIGLEFVEGEEYVSVTVAEFTRAGQHESDAA